MEGKTLVHLQCHFGMDTLQWSRAGAFVSGLDFSPTAIDEAISLAERAGLSERASFVCANVYDAPQVFSGKRFDVVYVSFGALCWLPDVAAWGSVVATLLAPGGRLYLHDGHPFTSCFDDDGERVVTSYFEEPEDPFVSDNFYTYTDGEELGATRTYEWNHSLGEIVAALVGNGLVVDSLTEHDWTLFQRFPWLEESASGLLVVPKGRPRIPLSFTVLAHAPG
jgi:SAM-dependent methyltransferase